MDEVYRSGVLRDLVPFWLQQSIEALSRFVGRSLEWQTDHIQHPTTDPPGLPRAWEGVVVYVQGHGSGFWLWAVGWPGPTAIQLLRWLSVSDDRDPMSGSLSLILDRPAQASALLEAGNVMAGTFFTAVAGFMNRALIPSPPSLFVGDSAVCQVHLRDLVAHETGAWVSLVGRLVGEGLELPQWTAVFITGGEVGR